MIDVNEPLELDDGTPVELVKTDKFRRAYVRLPMDKSEMRNRPKKVSSGSCWWYDIEDSCWSGGSKKGYFFLQNADAGPPIVDDWS